MRGMEGDISEMLRQVMENPQFGAMVQAVKSQLGTEGDGTPDPAKIMEKMPDLLSVFGPVLQGTGTKEKAETDTAETEDVQKTGEAASGDVYASVGTAAFPPVLQQFFRPGSREKRNKLLGALKPYLSPARCALIDRAMSAMQLGELLGTVMPQDNSR